MSVSVSVRTSECSSKSNLCKCRAENRLWAFQRSWHQVQHSGTTTVASTDARVSYVSGNIWSPPFGAMMKGLCCLELPAKPRDFVQGRNAAGRGSAENRCKTGDAKYSQTALLTAFKQGKELGVVSTTDKGRRVIAKLEGGRGTVGAYPWSPDSRRLTFISYQLGNSQSGNNREENNFTFRSLLRQQRIYH